MECHSRHFAQRCDLQLVTHADIPSGPGRTVHRQLSAGSDTWRRCWTEADVFVFPSRLETFGIVLLEALAFEVPIISSRAGAAASILENGALGVLLPDVTADGLRVAIEAVLGDPAGARQRAELGRLRFERDFELAANTERLAGWIRESVNDAR
jgi:glycosyltransferase involved in cell wall biosynthesis